MFLFFVTFKFLIILQIIFNTIKIPTNFNLSYFFNRGSFLGFILSVQILTGLLIALLFNPSVENFFLLLNYTNENFFFFFLRYFHANGASFFFIIIIFHIFRGIIYFSYKKSKLFSRGVIIYLLLIIISFFGYVLPWGQISFWGRRVITNFLRVLKNELVFFLWGDFIPRQKLIFFFFSLHFFMPFLLLLVSIIHILLLHEISSRSKTFKSLNKKKNLIFFLYKDLNNLFIILIYYIFIFFFFSSLGDSENFIESNKIVTPNHIKPEWYFLWAYSILRAIPSKLGGVLILVLSIFFFIKFLFFSKNFFFKKKIIILLVIFFFLTFLGRKPVEIPYLFVRQIFSIIYFLIIIF